MSKKDIHRNKRDKEILSYLSGDMSDIQKNLFEKDMERDPFLADAVEGMSGINPSELKSDLENLSALLINKQHKRKPVYYRIAAAVVVLLGISSILLVRQLKGPELMSDNLLSAPPASKSIEQEKVVKIVEDITEQEKAPERENIDKEKALVERSKQLEKPADLQNKTVTVEAEAILLDEVLIKDEVPLVMVTDTNSGIIERKAIDLNNDIENRVAGVQVEEAKVLTESAVVSERDLNVKSVPLAAKKSLGAVYKEDIELEEVVEITATENDDRKESDSYIKASPEIGIRDFRKYIETYIQFPVEWTKSDREVVRIKFRVAADKTLSNFEIVRSSDTLFSTEAIRLIKEGPLWKPAFENGAYKEESVVLRIVFRRE